MRGELSPVPMHVARNPHRMKFSSPLVMRPYDAGGQELNETLRSDASGEIRFRTRRALAPPATPPNLA